MEQMKKDTCGIIAVCTGWLLPIVGITLGIIALSRREKNPALGILALVESVIFWIMWAVYLL